MKIALLNAHTSYAQGASASHGGVLYKEYEWSCKINKAIKSIFECEGISSYIIDASSIEPYNKSLSYKASLVNKDPEISVAIETHFNSAPLSVFNNTSTGLEVLYAEDRVECEKFAKDMVIILSERLPFKIRRKDGLYPIDRNKIYILNYILCPVIIIELLFVSNPLDVAFLLHPRAVDVIALAIHDGIEKHLIS